ncbi:hypothetical protein P775_18425 [Puniceibacterium antarcticum]|uniref:Glycosyltransferase 2-like domain-containing protein n=1 Tax=Puniceibacterium antarcticum TaxID=1206336 RepID=A0A2G8RAT4_9RHOB|nr:hypothetical protein [Puniceibacterium antarcticum]PIL18551.1 hypothetical protein P775_18425 [Puniceibacterium antarcticum]
MAQAPAAPKLKRTALRAAVCVFGPRLSRHGEALLPSERAALDLRIAQKGRTRSHAETVTFLIPLVSPDHVGDWDAVTARLNQTLQSLMDQSDPSWRAVICCQQKPPLPDDPRITHLPFSDPTPGNDKWRKLAALYDHLPKMSLKPGYVISFDADDLLRQATVAEMLKRQSPGGYLVRAGYVMDAATGAIALADAPDLSAPLRKPFWKLCGSCTALFHDPDLPQSAAFLRSMTQHEHRMFPYLAGLAGQTLTPLSRPSVLYVLNHGENFGARRGRVGFKTRFVDRFKITDPATLLAIAQDFPTP